MGIRLGAYKTDALGLLLIMFSATCAVLSSAWVATLYPERVDLTWIIAAAAIFALLIFAVVLSYWVLGVYLLAATLPFDGILTLGPVASGVKVLALLTFCALGLRLLQDSRLLTELLKLWHNPLVIFASALVVWSAASVLWADEQGVALAKTVTFLGLLALMLVVALLDNRQSTILWGVLAFSTFLSVPVGYLLYSPTSGDFKSQRFSAGNDPNDYASLLAIVMIVAFFGLFRRSKVAAGALSFALIVGILTSQSRTGLLVLAAVPLAVLFVPRLMARLAGRTLLVYGFALAVFVSIALVAPSTGDLVSERYSTLTQANNEDTWSGRWSIWQGAVQVISSNPVLGVGSGNFPYVSPAYSAYAAQMEGAPVAHNIFLSVTSELGFVGLTLFLGILYCAFRGAFSLVNRNSVLGMGLFLGLVGFVLAGQSLTWEYEKLGYLLYGSILSLQLHSATQANRKDREGGQI